MPPIEESDSKIPILKITEPTGELINIEETEDIDTESEVASQIEALIRDRDPILTTEVLPYVLNLIDKSNKSKVAKDYCISVILELIKFETKEIYEEAREESDAMAGIDMHKLVRKPKMFNGKAEHPKLWLEEYHFCCDLNSWTIEQKIKYFPAFLEDSALRWFMYDVKPKLTTTSSWQNIVDLFNANYGSRTSDALLGRQIDHKYQSPNEKVNDFIADMRAMLNAHDPTLAEAKQVQKVADRILPSFQRTLAMEQPETYTKLIELCIKIEAGIAKSKPRAVNAVNVEEEKKIQHKTSYQKNKKVDKRDVKKQVARPCYRCERNGHFARECYSKTKKDGTSLENVPIGKEAKPPRKDNPQRGGQPSKPNSTQHKEGEVILTSHINVVLGLTGGNKVDFMKILPEIGGFRIESTIDSGALHSILSERVARKYNFSIEANSSYTLKAANNLPLIVLGITRQTMSLRIKDVTKTTLQRFIVARDLPQDVLLGRDWQKLFKLSINNDNDTVSYSDENNSGNVNAINSEDIVEGGPVFASTTTKIPARSQMLLPIKASNSGECMILPTNKNGELKIGNTVCDGTGDKAVVVMNPTPCSVQVQAGVVIGRFESTGVKEASGCDINLMVNVDEQGNTINVGDNLDINQINDVKSLMTKYKEVFAFNGQLGRTNITEHRIELIEGAKPIAEPLRRHAEVEKQAVREQVADMLSKGIIEESKSPWASAYVLVRKKNGQWRFCVDYRKVNELTKKNVYPLPRLDDCLDFMCDKNFFTLFDFASGYWQIPMEQSSKEVTAFRTHEGHWQFNCMPFGLCNSGASFQKLVDSVFSGLKGVDLMVYIDDTCIASKSWPEHINAIDKVLKCVKDARLVIQPAKCTIGANTITFLGHVISSNGIHPDPENVRAIKEMPTPNNAGDIQRFNGMVSYYRRLIPNLARITEPLSALTRKGAEWQWGEKQEKAFKHLKNLLSSDLCVTCYDHRRETRIKTDACSTGIGGILQQKSSNGDWMIVACCSRHLNTHERNWHITRQEGLAMVWTIQRFRAYLLGKHFTVLVDHCPLCVLNNRKPNTPQLARWGVLLSEYNMTIEYVKGGKHEDVDCLSRAPVESSSDRLDEIIVYIFILLPVDTNEWLDAYANSVEAQALLQKAENNEDEVTTIDGILYKENKIYLPTNMRSAILRKNHDDLMAGHGGRKATLERLQTNYWWPTIMSDVKNYVDSCVVCQQRKRPTEKTHGLMESFFVEEVFECVAIDCVGPWKATRRANTTVMVAIDMFSRFVEATASQSTTAIEFAKFFMTNICFRYGYPKQVLSDNAATFGAEVVKEVMKLSNVKHIKSTPLHSQGNAVVERVNQTLSNKLAMIVNSNDQYQIEHWDDALPAAVFSINTTVHSSTKCTPFELMYGRHPLNQCELTRIENITVHQLYSKLIKLQLSINSSEAIMNNKNKQVASRMFYDARHKHREYPANAYVWVFKKDVRGKKLANNYEGPFIVVKHCGNNVYELKNQLTSKKIKRHVSCLKAVVQRHDNNEIDDHDYQDDDTSSLDSESTEVYTPPSNQSPNRRQSPGAGTSSTFLVGIIMASLILMCTSQLHKQESPVVWRRSDKLVLTGNRAWDLTIAMKSPCTRDLGVTDPNAAEQLHMMCQRLFDNEVMTHFNNWCNPVRGIRVAVKEENSTETDESDISKRQVLEVGAGVALEYVVSSVIESARGWFRGTSEHNDEERVALLTSEVNKLQLHANDAYMAEKAQSEILHTLARQVSTNTKELNEMARNWPTQAWKTFMLQNEIYEAGNKLTKVISS